MSTNTMETIKANEKPISTDPSFVYAENSEGGFVKIPVNTLKSIVGIDVDEELSKESQNPVQNKVVTEKFNEVSTTVGNIDALLQTI